jgi:hypothetical protein
MRLILALLCLLPLAAFANEEPLTITSTTPTADTGSSLTFQLIALTDQRCPANVDCYWEGMIRAEIAVTEWNADPVTIILCNMCDDGTNEAKVAGHTITLGRLSPTMEDIATFGRPAILADYRLALTVSP